MRGAVLYGKDDVRLEELPDPGIVEPTDAIVRIAATCVCGSDLWHYRGINPPPKKPSPFGHEYCGVVEAVGADVTTIRPGDFVIGSFFASDGTCPNCRNGFQTFCLHMQPLVGCQAEVVRVPWADGTLVATPEIPSAELIPSLLAASDVLGTGWFAADSAQVAPGMTVAVVGGGSTGAPTLGRLGGEEFLVLMPGAALATARELAERMRAAVASHTFVLPAGPGEGRPVVAHRQTISLGVAEWTSAMLDASDLLDAADRRLYQAKHEGRDRVCC